MPSHLSEPTPPQCATCEDTGFELTDKGARPCECRLNRIRDSRFAKIPPKFAGLRLADIQPRKGQEQIITFAKENPQGSYFLAGNFGTGKSMLMWALYREAIERNAPKLIACTLAELLNEYRGFINGGPLPRMNATELKQSHTRYSIFFDDIDKAKPTEYAAEQFFEIVNAIYEYGHQVVTTTNLGVSALIDHFDRADERFGGAIVRRLVDNAKIAEMF
jgi:DNA replication protein DnaC